MMKFVIILAFVCFQLSLQEGLTETENVNDELIPQPAKDIPSKEMLDGADEDLWYKGKDENLDDDWTEEDEKWLQDIQGLLEGSDEDYDDDFSETEKLMDEIEAWIKKNHPDKGNYKWLLQIENWFDNIYDDLDFSLYPDSIKKKEKAGLTVEKSDNFDLYYSWLYRQQMRNSKNEDPRSVKRFSSV